MDKRNSTIMNIIFESGSSHTWLLDIGIAAIGTAFGALAGSWFSYFLERRARERVTKELNITAANLSLTLLFNHWYGLLTYKIDCLESADRTKVPWLQATATYPRPMEDSIKFDVKSLSFLSIHDHDILPTLLMIQSNNIVLFSLLSRRFNLIDDISKHPKPNTAGERDESYWRIAVGDAKIIELKQIYGHLWETVERELKSTHDAFAKLHDILIRIYPDSGKIIANSDFDEEAVRVKVRQ
ncbi:MAG: hypothetical protein ACHQ1H_10070 [Nitrososphaerales archaeon]